MPGVFAGWGRVFLASGAVYRRKVKHLAFPALVALAVSAVPGIANAQSPQPPTREELGVGRAPEGERPSSRLSVEEGIERGPCPLAEPAFANIEVSFSSVEFSGLPGISADVLGPAWRELAGRTMPIAALCEVRDRAATILRDLGYLAAVQVPAQRIEQNGVVHMDVLAAKLVELQVRGDAGPSASLIAAHLEPLTERPWFNTREAERRLLLLQDLPGYNVRLTLRSADRAPGEVIGDIELVRVPLEIVFGAQNFASKATGREGFYTAVTLNDVLGTGDRTTLSTYSTFDWKEQQILQLSHEMALNADGLRLGGGVLLGYSKPSSAGGIFNSQSVIGEVHISDALVRRQAHSVYATAGFELVDQKLDFGSIKLSDDRLRVLYLRFDDAMIDPASIAGRGGYSASEPRWRSALSLELRHGIDVLGASSDCDLLADCLPPNVPISILTADPSAFVARFQGTFEFRPVPRVTFAVSPMAQVSDGPLLPYEQVSLGNYTIGRGLDPGVAQGDGALGASFELRFGSIYSRRPEGFAFEPFVFFDYASAWIDDDGLNPDPRDVLTAGGGVRGRWGDHIDAGMVLAVPLQRAGYQLKPSDPRLLFTLTARLQPWGTR